MSPRTRPSGTTVTGDPGAWVLAQEVEGSGWVRRTYFSEQAGGALVLVEMELDNTTRSSAQLQTSVVFVPNCAIRNVGGFPVLLYALPA